MKKKMIKSICVLAFLVAGTSAYAQQAQQTQAPQQVQQQDWQQLETQNGVLAYWKTAPLGSGEGVYLRFVNTTGQPVTVNWTINCGADGKESHTGSTTIASGEAATPAGVRISGNASVSFNVSK